MSSELVPADVRVVWDQIKPGLHYVLGKTNAPWRPEDVYHTLISGAAYLYVGDSGFVILQPKADPFTGQSDLLVWIAYSPKGDAAVCYQAALDDIAREAGFKKLVLWSNRPGWERVSGWTQTAAVYERAV